VSSDLSPDISLTVRTSALRLSFASPFPCATSMATMTAGHLPYPVANYMAGYENFGGYTPNDKYATHASQALAPLQPDPYDAYKNTAAVAPSASAPTFDHYRARSSLQNELPPMASVMRYEDRLVLEQAQIQQAQMQHRRQKSQADILQEQQHEEKAVGGVSAKLDYDMDRMTEFVAEMAAGMYAIYMSRICISDIDLVQSIKPGISPSTTFRKWVLQVLNATRLPSATILLSLSYLSLRVRDLSATGRFLPSERSLYQMLTVALILGSKFLDDNTFQNKSWAEVSNISVVELNRDEREWLKSFEHRLHHDPNTASGYSVWECKWHAWQAAHVPYTYYRRAGSALRHQTSMRSSLPPLKPHTAPYSLSIRGSRASEASYVAPVPYSAYDAWTGQRTTSDRSSPSTAPQSSGPHTPEYYNWSKAAATAGPYGYSALPSFHADFTAYQPYSMPMASYNQAGNMWTNHGGHCQCSNCRSHMMQTRYNTVAAA
jgi:hypothetical protein